MTRDPIDVALGTPVEAIETPAVLLDLDAFEANCRSISGHLRARGWPGAPMRRAIARPTSHAGRWGSARSASRSGKFPRPRRWRRAASPASSSPRNSRPSGCGAAGPAQGRRRSDRAGRPPETGCARGRGGSDHRHSIPVAVDVDLGINRSGVQPGEPALDLARRIAATPGLRLAGIIGYEGHLLRTWPLEEKERAIREALAGLTATADLLRAEGLTVGLVSAGGTGSTRSAPTCPASANSRPEAAASWTSSTPRTATSTAWSSR